MQKFFIRGSAIDVVVETGHSSPSLLRFEIAAKHFPRAVMRNKIKRWCREAWRYSSLSASRGVLATVRVKKRTPQYQTIMEDFLEAKIRVFQ